MAGHGTENIEQLLCAADERGSLTTSEIAEILDARELPVEIETNVRIGE